MHAFITREIGCQMIAPRFGLNRGQFNISIGEHNVCARLTERCELAVFIAAEQGLLGRDVKAEPFVSAVHRADVAPGDADMIQRQLEGARGHVGLVIFWRHIRFGVLAQVFRELRLEFRFPRKRQLFRLKAVVKRSIDRSYKEVVADICT